MRRGGSGGQATVELVALLPLLVGVVLAATQVLAAGRAAEAADAAAHAAAMALLQAGDPRGAAREALAGWPADRTRVRVSGREVAVAVEPRGPVRALTRRLVAESRAVAGGGR